MPTPFGDFTLAAGTLAGVEPFGNVVFPDDNYYRFRVLGHEISDDGKKCSIKVRFLDDDGCAFETTESQDFQDAALSSEINLLRRRSWVSLFMSLGYAKETIWQYQMGAAQLYKTENGQIVHPSLASAQIPSQT